MNRWLRVLVAIFLGLAGVGGVEAAPAPQGAPARGAVYTLRGTPHLWIAGEDGVLHWSGDTRGLKDRFVDWGNKKEVSPQELRAMRRGDPWLSAGLLKMGDPIYFVKWESDQPRPTLLHIRSIADLELFGINEHNYGTYVMEQPGWEQRYGMGVATLSRGELMRALAPGSFREQPLPIGVSARIAEGWEAKVLSATPNATSVVLRENRFNSPPEPGHQFYMVRISLTYVADGPVEPGPKPYWRAGQFKLVGNANVAYSRGLANSCGVVPDALPTTEVFPGGTITGNICWEVPSAEADSLVLYNEYLFPGGPVQTYFGLR